MVEVEACITLAWTTVFGILGRELDCKTNERYGIHSTEDLFQPWLSLGLAMGGKAVHVNRSHNIIWLDNLLIIPSVLYIVVHHLLFSY